MKKILLSMILLALCLIQASADNYYYKIKLYNDYGQPGAWSKYIKVEAKFIKEVNGVKIYDYTNGLGKLLNGETVTGENNVSTYKLPKKADKVDLDRIYGIEFANGKGRYNNAQENILEGDEYDAWKQIRGHIKYLGLREYIRDSYNDDSYFMYMDNVEELELPKDGMNVGSGDDHGIRYFANAYKLKKITILSGEKQVDITDDAVKDKPLLNRVGKFMFSNCCSLSTKYINRLIKNVTEIKDNAFYANDDNRKFFSDGADNEMAIVIPSSVTKIGKQAFYNRVKVTGLNIQGNGSLEIGSQAFRRCEQLHTLNLDNAKITYLGTGVFGDCRSMTNEFVNGVLQNYAVYGEIKKIPAYLFFGCNGQVGSDGKKTVCSPDFVIVSPKNFRQRV